MNRKRFALMSMILAGIAMGAVSAAPVFGHDGATGVVKERMDTMKSIGKAMKGLSAMVKGERAYDAAEVKTLATSIQSKSKRSPRCSRRAACSRPARPCPPSGGIGRSSRD